MSAGADGGPLSVFAHMQHSTFEEHLKWSDLN